MEKKTTLRILSWYGLTMVYPFDISIPLQNVFIKTLLHKVNQIEWSLDVVFNWFCVEDGLYESQVVLSLGWVGLGLRLTGIFIRWLFGWNSVGSSHFLGGHVTFWYFLFFKVLMKIVSFRCFMGNFLFSMLLADCYFLVDDPI